LLYYLRTADTTQFNQHNEHVLKELARVIQYFGQQLSLDLAFNNTTRHGFYVKQTSVPFKKQRGRKFPFKNCSGHRKHVTDGFGDQKIIYSPKPEFNVAMYEYYVGPKQKAAASDTVYSLLVVAPPRSDEVEPEQEPDLVPESPVDSYEEEMRSWLN
jgi:hypothetical protein